MQFLSLPTRSLWYTSGQSGDAKPLNCIRIWKPFTLWFSCALRGTMCTAVIRYTRLIVFVEIEPSLCLQIVCTAQFSSRNGTALLYTPPVATQLNCYSTVRRTIVIALALRLRVARRWRPRNATTTPRRDANVSDYARTHSNALILICCTAHTTTLLDSTTCIRLFFVLRSLHAHLRRYGLRLRPLWAYTVVRRSTRSIVHIPVLAKECCELCIVLYSSHTTLYIIWQWVQLCKHRIRENRVSTIRNCNSHNIFLDFATKYVRE